MQRIASGGELSRIQLAIAAALFATSHAAAAATLVFDEIDAGIGGRVAEVVGRKLQQLAARNQVICVTHLPQIASFGTTHFYVWKEDLPATPAPASGASTTPRSASARSHGCWAARRCRASAIAHARELLAASVQA